MEVLASAVRVTDLAVEKLSGSSVLDMNLTLRTKLLVAILYLCRQLRTILSSFGARVRSDGAEGHQSQDFAHTQTYSK